MNRRTFLQSAAMAATTATLTSCKTMHQTDKSTGVNWPIGCFNRPWSGDKNNWGYDVALDGMKAAGYKVTGLLTRSPQEPFTGSDATPEYLRALKGKIAARGLTV